MNFTEHEWDTAHVIHRRWRSIMYPGITVPGPYRGGDWLAWALTAMPINDAEVVVLGDDPDVRFMEMGQPIREWIGPSWYV